MLDYKEQKIYLNGYVVGPLTIIGLAAELFWRLAVHDRRGFNALTWTNVQAVEIRNAVVNERSRSSLVVAVPRKDAEKALRVSRVVAERLEQSGFRILDAIVAQWDASGRKVGSRISKARSYALAKYSNHPGRLVRRRQSS